MVDTLPPTAPVEPASPPAPQALALGDTGRVNSSAASDAPWIAPAAPESAREPELLPMRSTAQALFSTDLGRQGKRPVAIPPTPVIAFSDQMVGIVDFAAFWRNKYPLQYLCYFPHTDPTQRWTIQDLWDEQDIQLYTAQFLTKVLEYITHHNLNHARHFAVEWSKNNCERLPFVAQQDIYDHDRPLNVVDKIFIDGETTRYPREFLWHVANVMRMGMFTVYTAQQAERSTAGAGAMTKASDKTAGKSNPTLIPAAEIKPKVTTQAKQPKPGPTPGTVPQMLHQPPFTHPVVMSAPVSNSRFNAPIQPSRMALENQPVALPHGGFQSPQLEPSQLRNHKTRNGRQHSSSHAHQPSTSQHMSNSGWAVSNQQMGPYAQQSRQYSGPTSAMPSPHYQAANMAHPMMHSVNPTPAFMQGPPVMGPSMQSHTHHNPPMMHGGMPPQASHFGAPGMGPILTNFVLGPPVGLTTRDMHMNDMTNAYYAPGNMSNMEQHVNMVRRDSRSSNQKALYNPYGESRPDFGRVPSQPVNQRDSRDSFPNPQDRGRKFSVGSSSRPLSYSQHNFNRGDFVSPPLGVRQLESSFTGPLYFGSKSQNDPIIVDDLEYGCTEFTIGPKNDRVNQLIIFDFPTKSSPDELKKFAEKYLGFKVAGVRIQSNDPYKKPVGYLDFASVADARRGLQLNNATMSGQQLQAKVPRRYFTLPQNRYVSGGPQLVHQGGRRMSFAQNNHNAVAEVKVTYSPQDARSGQQPRSSQQSMGSTGSPEVRQPKLQGQPTTGQVEVDQEERVTMPPPSAPSDVGKQPDVATVTAAPETIIVLSHVSAVVEPVTKSADKIHTGEQQILGVDEASHASAIDTAKHENPDPAPEPSSHAEVEANENVTISDNDLPKELAQENIETSGNATFPNKLIPEDLSHKEADAAQTSQTALESTPADLSQTEPEKSSIELDVPAPSETDTSETIKGADSEKTDLFEGPTLSADDIQAGQEPTSDDEQKNEASFHSAKETQSDFEKLEVKAEITVNEFEMSHAQKLKSGASGMGIEEATMVKGGKQKMTTESGVDENAKDIIKPNESNTEAAVSTPTKASTPAEKKPSTSKTEPMSVFGQQKAAQKAQKKKEKAAQKKEKKKTKVAKVAPAATLTERATGFNDGSQTSKNMSSIPPKLDESTPVAVTPGSLDEEHQPDRAEKDNSMEEPKAASEMGDIPKQEVGSDTGGKQPMSTLIASVVGQASETLSIADIEHSKQKIPDADVAGDAASNDEDPLVEAAKSIYAPSDIPPWILANGLTSTQIDEIPKEKIKEEAKVAIPLIKSDSGILFPPPSKNTVGPKAQTPPSEIKTDPLPVDVRSETEFVDNASIASSSTLPVQNSDSKSPNPTVLDFHTPLQTPSGLESTPSGLESAPPEKPKKKKFKRGGRKKNQDTAATDANAATETRDTDDLPYETVNKQIEEYRETKKATFAQPDNDDGPVESFTLERMEELLSFRKLNDTGLREEHAAPAPDRKSGDASEVEKPKAAAAVNSDLQEALDNWNKNDDGELIFEPNKPVLLD